jgi:hypothetical protein
MAKGPQSCRMLHRSTDIAGFEDDKIGGPFLVSGSIAAAAAGSISGCRDLRELPQAEGDTQHL